MEKYKLGEICEIVTGSTPKTNEKEYWDGDIKWITPAELNDDSYIIYDSKRKITELAVEKTGLTSFPQGTVILSSRAPIGKVAIAGCEMYCNQGFKNLICSEKINNKYLYWFLKRNTKYLNSLGRGATFKEISKTIVANIEIDVPELKKQLDVVHNLEKVNSIIKLRKRELKLSDELIKARFVEMFGDPVSASKEEKVELVELCEKITDGEHGSVTRLTKGHPFLNAKHILKNGNIDCNTVTFIGDTDHQKIYKRCNPEKGDILLTTTGTIGNVAILPECEEVSMDRGITLLKIDRTKVTSEFVAEMLRQESIQMQMGANVHASAIGHLFMNKVKKLPVILPNIERQIEFTKFVKQVDKLKLQVQKSLDETQLLFDSLIQQYFG